MLTKNSDPDFLIIIFVSLGIILLFITTVLSLVFLTRRRFIKHEYEKQLLKQTYEQEKLKAEIEVQEQTFTFLSGEIHDNIGQSLSLVKLNLNMGSPAQIEQAKEILTNAIQSLRQMAQSLDSDNLKNRDLISSIRNEISRLELTKVYRINFEINTDEDEPVIDNQILIIRIFQEALNNIIKHSEAKSIHIRLTFLNSQFTLEVKDDGVGFEADRIHEGIGLMNMRKRTALIGGNLQFTSIKGNGTRFVLTIDLHKISFHNAHNDSSGG